ncbi:MAG: chemotaxis protein CheX [bacterium]
MRIEYVKPFIESVIKTMEMMLGVKPRVQKPYLKGTQPNWGDVSGIIGFAGEKVIGSVAISMPQRSALGVYKLMMSDTVTDITPDIQDSIGELTNIVAGNAKNFFAERNMHFNLTVPSVIVGKRHNISYKENDKVLVIPFDMDNAPFVLELLLKVADEPS